MAKNFSRCCCGDEPAVLQAPLLQLLESRLLVLAQRQRLRQPPAPLLLHRCQRGLLRCRP